MYVQSFYTYTQEPQRRLFLDPQTQFAHEVITSSDSKPLVSEQFVSRIAIIEEKERAFFPSCTACGPNSGHGFPHQAIVHARNVSRRAAQLP